MSVLSKTASQLVFAFGLMAFSVGADAENKLSAAKYWYLSGSANALYSTYDGSQWRENMNTLGGRFDLDYLNYFHVDMAYNRVLLTYTTDDELLQDEWFVNGQKHFYLDSLAGRVSLLAGFIYLENDQNDLLLSYGQDDSSLAYIYSVGGRYLSYKQNYYLNSQYTYSFYVNFEVAQWFNQAGLALGNHWFTVANYYIQSDETTSAYEFSWKYSVAQPWLDSVSLSYMLGERLYAIEPDANVVLNLADKQTGSVKLGALIPLSESLDLELMASYSKYQYFLQSDLLDNRGNHSQTSAYLNIKVKI